MRVLHLVDAVDNPANGTSNVVVDLAVAQAADGDTVAVASKGGRWVELLAGHGVECPEVPFDRRPGALARSVASLRALLAQWKPDVVHAHVPAAALCARLAGAGRRPLLVASIHSIHQRSSLGMFLAAVPVCVSRADARWIERRSRGLLRLPSVPNGPIGSLRCPVSGPGSVVAEPVAGTLLDHPAIVTVGAVSARKGADVLIEATGELRRRGVPVSTYFIGNVDWPDVHALVEERGLTGSVHFLGMVRDPRPLLERADVFAFPSLVESFGLAIVEARQAGLPIVASCVGGIPEACGGPERAVFVPASDAGALAGAIELLVVDPALRRDYARRASEGLEDLTVVRMVERYRALYEIGSGSSRP